MDHPTRSKLIACILAKSKVMNWNIKICQRRQKILSRARRLIAVCMRLPVIAAYFYPVVLAFLNNDSYIVSKLAQYVCVNLVFLPTRNWGLALCASYYPCHFFFLPCHCYLSSLLSQSGRGECAHPTCHTSIPRCYGRGECAHWPVTPAFLALWPRRMRSPATPTNNHGESGGGPTK